MKQAGYLFAVIAGGLIALDLAFGYATAYAISYGAVTLMAAAIAVTFLWLWFERTTPLALGMSMSWAGAASVMGWWWLFAMFDRPDGMVENEMLLIFVSLYSVGAILHFGVIGASMHLPRRVFLVPVLGSVAVSVLVHLIV